MGTNEKDLNELLFETAEKLYKAIHLSRAAIMAVDSLNQDCSEEKVEAVHEILGMQETMLMNVWNTLENIRVK